MELDIAQGREQRMREVNIMQAHSSREGGERASGAGNRVYADNQLMQSGFRGIGERINNNIVQVSRDSIEDY